MASPASTRTEAIDRISTTFLARASRLTRLLMSAGPRELSRTEAGLLLTLLDGPRRITDLSETEALAQPTVTQVVAKLERRGLVARERSTDDGRVVLVTVSEKGRMTLEETRTSSRELLRIAVAELSDEELAEFAATNEALARLVEAIQQGEPGK